MEHCGRLVSPLWVCHLTPAYAWPPGARPARAGVQRIAVIYLFCPYCPEINVLLNAVRPCSHESKSDQYKLIGVCTTSPIVVSLHERRLACSPGVGVMLGPSRVRSGPTNCRSTASLIMVWVYDA